MPNHPAQHPDDVYWTDGDSDVPVFQRPKEFAALLAIYERLAPARVLEVGSYFGGTLKQWIRRAPHGVTVVSIDTPVPGAFRPALWRTWAETATGELIIIANQSNDPATVHVANAYAPYDFVFIDADHYYDSVKRDYDLYMPMVRPGGLLAFHDILEHPTHPEIQVRWLWEEIKRTHLHTFELVEDRDAPWGGIGGVWL